MNIQSHIDSIMFDIAEVLRCTSIPNESTGGLLFNIDRIDFYLNTPLKKNKKDFKLAYKRICEPYAEHTSEKHLAFLICRAVLHSDFIRLDNFQEKSLYTNLSLVIPGTMIKRESIYSILQLIEDTKNKNSIGDLFSKGLVDSLIYPLEWVRTYNHAIQNFKINANVEKQYHSKCQFVFSDYSIMIKTFSLLREPPRTSEYATLCNDISSYWQGHIDRERLMSNIPKKSVSTQKGFNIL